MLYRSTVFYLLIFIIILSNFAGANYKPRIAIDKDGSVYINEEVAVRFRVNNGNLTPEDRAKLTAQRLIAQSEAGVKAEAFTAKADGARALVYAGDQVICIANPEDAKAANSTPLALAQSWTSNIKRLFALPPLKLSTNSLTVPEKENRRLKVGGTSTGEIQAKIENELVASIQIDQQTRVITVTGITIGETVLDVCVNEFVEKCLIEVKRYAGRVSVTSPAQVTGNPAPISLLEFVARQKFMESVILEYGTKVSILSVNAGKTALETGARREAKVAYRITGEGYLPVNAEIAIPIENINLPREEAEQIFYSNDPESLRKFELLYAARLQLHTPTKVLYHHQNFMGQRIHFIVEIVNTSDIPATFRISDGISAPNIDTYHVGYVAVDRFFNSELSNISYMQNVPPYSRLILVSDMLKNHDTSSGIFQIKQISSNPALVRITAAQPNIDNVSVGQILPAPQSLVVPYNQHVYEKPVKKITETYTVGGRWTFISVGRHPLVSADNSKTLHGNYGVKYDITVKVENPTNRARKVEVAFEPSAGMASGIFYVDGKKSVVKYATPPKEITLNSYNIQPGETRNIRIVTIPLAGSNYPITVIVKS
ncbi:MAG: hypothetical protein SNJ70_00555 [Armatimonadota bacterium]